jgi:hypothetical protein
MNKAANQLMGRRPITPLGGVSLPDPQSCFANRDAICEAHNGVKGGAPPLRGCWGQSPHETSFHLTITQPPNPEIPCDA